MQANLNCSCPFFPEPSSWYFGSVSGQPSLYLHIGLPKTATTTLQLHGFRDHPDLDYLGTHLPRILNQDPLFNLLSAYVMRGEGQVMDIRKRLIARIESGSRPLMISEENFIIGAFDGYPASHPFSQTRAEKLSRLNDVIEGMDFLVLVSLRPFAASVFSAFVEYQEQWQQSNLSIVETVKTGDAMGMYRTAELRKELHTLWSDKVVPIAFEHIVAGQVSIPGFSWQADKPVPNARQHNKTERGVLREMVSGRPFLRLARWIAGTSPSLARRLWSIRTSQTVLVEHWGEDLRNSLAELEQASDAARRSWLESATSSKQQ